jgi:hypothetical protein
VRSKTISVPRAIGLGTLVSLGLLMLVVVAGLASDSDLAASVFLYPGGELLHSLGRLGLQVSAIDRASYLLLSFVVGWVFCWFLLCGFLVLVTWASRREERR